MDLSHARLYLLSTLGHVSMHIFTVYYIHSLYGITNLGEHENSDQLRVP